jgi:PilZ domain
MDTTGQSIFEQAVDDGWEVPASIGSDQEMYRFNARLTRRQGECFWFEADAWPPGIDAVSEGLKISFESGTKGGGVVFDAEVQSIELDTGEASAATVCCLVPSEVRVVQRRANFRTPVPANAPVTIVVWKIPPHWVLRDRPKPSSQIRVELVDLSEGGTCLKVYGSRVGKETAMTGDRLRIEMRFGESEAILDGQVVYCINGMADEPYRVGVAFRKHENVIEGRRALSFLDRVIAALQQLALKESTAATA